MSLLTAEQVADRLGVKVATVYAYVSRGHLASQTRPGSRRSWFDEAAVEQLARRGRPRRTTRPAALDFTIESSLTTIDEHDLRYRGRSALGMARTAAFEEVAEWLWTGSSEGSAMPWHALDVAIPDVGEARDRLRVAVVLAAAGDPLRGAPERPAVLERARSLIATMTEAVAADRGAKAARLHLPGRPAALRATIAGRLWSGLSPKRPTPASVAVLNAALVLLVDHELAVSTLAARVAASARADPYAVVLAGMGPLAGPLHGGASRFAYELIESAMARGSDAALARALEFSRNLGGFGHRVYLDGDQRASVLMDLVRDAYPDHPVMRTADRLVATARRQAWVEPNIDFALAAMAHVCGMPADAGETIFTIARTVGWIAHGIEEYDEAPLRFRARAVPRRRGVVALSDSR